METVSARETLPGEASAHDLAHGFAEHAGRWAQACHAERDAVAAVRHAAFRLSLAMAEGHVCLPLLMLAGADEASNSRAALRTRLLASGVVESGSSTNMQAAVPGSVACPLVLDAHDRLYLRRYYQWECQLAAALARMVAVPPMPLDENAVRKQLARLFPAVRVVVPDWQQLAVALALQRRLTIISGGPGTGKTTTVAALLACLIALRKEAAADATPLNIVLAAPTGKAAARMLEALVRRAETLPPEIREHLPTQAYTLHRLLGVTPRPGQFRHHAGNPLALDILVVDEASMLDLALAARLFDALPAHARLILLGDKDQLAAVEAGAVFAELSATQTLSAECAARLAALTEAEETLIRPLVVADNMPLQDTVVWLMHSHRFSSDSGIGRLAAHINAGQGEAALAWLRNGKERSIEWIDEMNADAQTLPARLRAGYAAYIDALHRYVAGDPAPVFAAFERFRVLCVVHGGPRGVAAINAWMSAEMRRGLDKAPFGNPLEPSPPICYFGRPLIILRNDAVFGLFNGDIGICLPDAQGVLLAWFPDAQGRWRAIAPLRLPEHDTAFALTVHKSQGSEFDEVLVVLPPAPSCIMSRELIYTAVTRAAHRIAIMGRETVFVAACATPTQRDTGLMDRLREQAAHE